MHRQPRVPGGASPASVAAAGGAAASPRLVLAETRPPTRREGQDASDNRQESDEDDEGHPHEGNRAHDGEDGAEAGPDTPNQRDSSADAAERVPQAQKDALGVTAPSYSPRTPGNAEAVALELARRECCARLCLRSVATDHDATTTSGSSNNSSSSIQPSESLRHLVASLAAMTKAEKKVCMFTSLSISSLVKSRPQRAPRPREEGVRARNRFVYWLPLVGEVCRAAFMAVFGVSHCSLNRYRKQLEDDKRLVPQPHGNANNANAKVLDDELLVRWFREFAGQVGEQVTRRVRVRKTENGQRKSAMVEQRHVQLPARLTWEQLLHEFKAHAVTDTASGAPRAHRPSLASFRRILSDKCPEIRLSGASAAATKHKVDSQRQ